MSPRLAPLALLALTLCVPGCRGELREPTTAGGSAAAAPEAAGAELLALAREAALWIDASAFDLPGGVGWPASPAAPESRVSSLYSGTPGVVLYLLELHRADPDGGWEARALAGAGALAEGLPAEAADIADYGLYTGLSGQCLALLRAAESPGSDPLRRAGERCLDLVVEGAGREPGWGQVTDIIAGWSGIGTFLLWAGTAYGREDALEAARVAGDRLLSVAIREPEGLNWAMAPEFPRMMPNFSHGTAGVAYFLARLHDATGDPRYLEGALAGGRYLLSIADTEGDVCLIYHHSPGGTDLNYLSWCHGPAGTARTFYALWQSTADPEWLEWAHRSAAAVMASGIPEQRTPGFWNNVGMCCGNAGVGDFFLDLYVLSGEERYLSFARRVIDDLVERATRDELGVRWLQAEHRVRPEELVAQTGWMQGAAGIGAVLLHLRAIETGGARPAALPDNPFPRALP